MDMSSLALIFTVVVAVGGVAYVFLYPLLSGERRAEKRQASIIGIAPETGRGRGSDRANPANRRESVSQSLKEIEQRQKDLTKLTLEDRIQQAGLSWNRRKFFIFSAVCGLVLGFVALLGTFNPLLALGVAFVGCVGFPQWWLKFLKARRIKKFVNEFPNAIDVIVRGVKAGLPLGDCLRIIAAEASEPVKSEFRYIVEQQTLGITMGEACAKLFQRVPVTEANFFGIVVMIQSKTGGSLAEALSNLSRVLRERKKMKGKISAMSMEAKASAAIIGSLPIIVMILLSFSSPKYVELLWIKETGKLALAAGGFWMFVGIMVMRKMISFDF